MRTGDAWGPMVVSGDQAMVEQSDGTGLTALGGYGASPMKIGCTSGRTRRGGSSGEDNVYEGSPTVAETDEEGDGGARV